MSILLNAPDAHLLKHLIKAIASDAMTLSNPIVFFSLLISINYIISISTILEFWFLNLHTTVCRKYSSF